MAGFNSAISFGFVCGMLLRCRPPRPRYSTNRCGVGAFQLFLRHFFYPNFLLPKFSNWRIITVRAVQRFTSGLG